MPGFNAFDIASTALFSFQTSGKRLGDPWFGQQGFFVTDCTMTEEHSSEIQVTEHPVEDGSDVTDNARPKPDMLSIEGFISETPFGTFWGNYDPANGGAETTQGYQFPNQVGGDPLPPLGRAQAAFDLLRRLKDESEPISVTTALHYYPTMLIESLRFPRDVEIGDSLKISIRFKAVRFVTSEVALITVSSTNSQGKFKKGTVAAKKIDPADVTSKLRSTSNKFGTTNTDTVDQPKKGLSNILKP